MPLSKKPYMDNQCFDVAVIGAGPSGSAIARRLARSGCRVVLIERTQFEKQRVGESLAPAVQPLLKELGVWSEFMDLNPIPSFGTRSSWGDSEIQEHTHFTSPYNNGWHVDRCAFDRMLADAAVVAGAELQCGTRLTQCNRIRENNWLLQLTKSVSGNVPDQLSELRARVVIDATGRAAQVSRCLGAQRILFDRLVGVAALIKSTNTLNESFILLESRPEGWWYSAPVSSNRMMAMFLTDSDICRRENFSAKAAFSKQLEKAAETCARFEGCLHETPRVFSAKSQRMHRAERKDHWIAIGDAALAVDPISGSGVVRALRSAEAGAATVLALLCNYNFSDIEKYENVCDIDCNNYLHERTMYYGIENRWQQLPFWQRRSIGIT